MIDKDTIIKLARRTWGESAILPFDELERFAQAIYRQGLEDAAQLADKGAIGEDPICCGQVAASIAKDIRALKGEA